MLRFSAFSWRTASPGRDADRDQWEKCGLARIVVVLAAVVWGLLGVSANAAETVVSRGAAHDGFGRIVFEWPAPVSYTAGIEGRTLRVTFARPLSVALDALRKRLDAYVSDVGVSSDGLTLEFSLTGDFGLRTFTSEKLVIVDLVAPAAAGAGGPRVAVRAGDHPGYSRVVFDWRKSVGYEVSLDDGRATIRFDRAATIGLESLNAAPPNNVQAGRTEIAGDQTVVILTVTPSVGLRHFRSGEKVVFDFLSTKPPAADVPAQADAQVSARPGQLSRPQAGEKAKELATAARRVQSPPTEAAARSPRRMVAPSPTQAAARSPRRMVAPSSTQVAASASPARGTTVVTGGASPPEPVSLVPSNTAVEPVRAPQPVKAKSIGTTAARVSLGPPPIGIAVATAKKRTLVSFNVGKKLAGAAFVRGGYLWVVVPERYSVDLDALQETRSPAYELVEQIPHDRATVLRFKLRKGFGATFHRRGAQWMAQFSSNPEPPAAIDVATLDGESSNPRARLTLSGVAETIELRDPDDGARLIVVPVTAAGAGVVARHRFPGFDLLATAQGIAVRPNGAEVEVLTGPVGVEVVAAEAPDRAPVADASEAASESAESAPAGAPDAAPGKAEPPPRSEIAADGDADPAPAPEPPQSTEIAVDDMAAAAPVVEPTPVEPTPAEPPAAVVATDGTPDAATDAAPDATPDAAPDVATDAATDVATDAAPDVATDAAPDVATDAPTDAGLLAVAEPIATQEAERPDRNSHRKGLGITLFNLAEWRRGGEKSFFANRRDLQLAAASAKERHRPRARLELARFLFAHGYFAELSGTLSQLIADVPNAADMAEVRAMRGVAELMLGRVRESVDYLNNPVLNAYDDVALWRGVLAMRLGDMESAMGHFVRASSLWLELAPHLRSEIGLMAAEAAVETNDLSAATTYLDAILVSRPAHSTKERARYLRGRVFYAAGNTVEAVKQWEKVNVDGSADQFARAGTLFYRTLMELENEEITTREAIDTLEKLRFAWRGDEFELRLLQRLAEMYVAEKEYRKGLEAMKQAVTRFAKHPAAVTLASRMSELFFDVFVEGGADTLSPRKALVLYQQFRELTPIGPAGDKVIQSLADRLVAVDLLARASEILDHQVNYRLRGLEKVKIGTRLAVIRLMDRKPDGALQALENSRIPGIPKELARQRRHLKARALADLGENDGALRLLARDTNRDAQLLRADIYWRAARWRKSAASTALVLKQTKVEKPVEGFASQQILRFAVALALANDRLGLKRARKRYLKVLEGDDNYEAFEVITNDVDRKRFTFRDLPAAVAHVAGFEAFLTSYRERVRKGALSAIN